jgi:hypothetical protein
LPPIIACAVGLGVLHLEGHSEEPDIRFAFLTIVDTLSKLSTKHLLAQSLTQEIRAAQSTQEQGKAAEDGVLSFCFRQRKGVQARKDYTLQRRFSLRLALLGNRRSGSVGKLNADNG